MKKKLCCCIFTIFTLTGIFAGSSRISITPPQIKDPSYTFLQPTIDSLVGQLEANLNSQYFSKLHDLDELTRGFANANAAAANNVSFMGYQNYDVFTFMLGANTAFAVPTYNLSEVNNIGNSIRDSGDLYAGLATGGLAGQLGINTSSFLMKGLYLSLRFGIFNYNQTSGSGDSKTDLAYRQFMVGLGANYRLVEPWDFGMGLLRWRGLSVGSGLELDSNTIQMKLSYPQQSLSQNVTSGLTYNVVTTVNNIQANLNISSLAFTVPVEIDTSVQLFYLLNLGLGLGADINIPGNTVKVDGSGNVNLTVKQASSPVAITTTPGTATLKATDSQNKLQFFDVVSPRISTDVGLNIWLFRIDVPMSFYPITKTFNVGINGGFSW